jgi:hypothetical protein
MEMLLYTELLENFKRERVVWCKSGHYGRLVLMRFTRTSGNPQVFLSYTILLAFSHTHAKKQMHELKYRGQFKFDLKKLNHFNCFAHPINNYLRILGGPRWKRPVQKVLRNLQNYA